MATGVLNTFKTVAANVTTTLETIYTTPSNYTAIVLMAQISNVSENTSNVTFVLTANTVNYELLKQFDVPKNDAVSGTVGKLIIETGNSVKIAASANDELKIVLSILETANE